MNNKKDKTMIESVGLAGLYNFTDPEMARKMIFGDHSNRVTGTIAAMKQTSSPDSDGNCLFVVFGVVKAPEKTFKDMHTYPLVGQPIGFDKTHHTEITISNEEEEDRTAEIKGMGVSGALRASIWRV